MKYNEPQKFSLTKFLSFTVIGHTDNQYSTVYSKTVCVYIGPKQGMCGCDHSCTCLSGWRGMACDCTLSTATCIGFLGVSIYCAYVIAFDDLTGPISKIYVYSVEPQIIYNQNHVK